MEFINIETSATDYDQIKSEKPFCHTNHYLSKKMKRYENSYSLKNSLTRYHFCCQQIKTAFHMAAHPKTGTGKAPDNIT